MNNIPMFKVLSIVLSCLFLTVGCAVDNELAERQVAALDVAGEYQALNDGKKSLLDMKITIKNEEMKHDIAIYVDRDRLSLSERNFYSQFGVLPADAEKLIRYISLGVGVGSWRKINDSVGGDNVSTDKGKSSSIFVCSEVYSLGQSHVVRHCLQAKIKSVTPELMTGVLITAVYKRDGAGNYTFVKDMSEKFVAELK